MDRVDAVVVGAGVVGLAVARRLALAGLETIVLEAEGLIGSETSSRNSEVIHAGIYYPTGSLRAELCVAGNKALYAYCDSHGVPYSRMGKLIVATTEAEVAGLKGLQAKAVANGVHDLTWLTPEEVKPLEPEVFCVAALLSPSTGVIDSHQLMLAYEGEAEARGTMLALKAPLVGGGVTADGIVLQVGGEAPMELLAGIVVNSAGLDAPNVAKKITGIPTQSIPRSWLAKGNYYVLQGRVPFKRLIYPMPEPGGLGVHVTIDLGGQARFGPDVEWVEKKDYTVDPKRAEVFYGAVRRYWPGLPDGAIQPGYAGIRPKLHGPGMPQPDFVIQGPEGHGVPGLVNLYGIESPGLTCSLTIADRVGEILNLPQ